MNARRIRTAHLRVAALAAITAVAAIDYFAAPEPISTVSTERPMASIEPRNAPRPPVALQAVVVPVAVYHASGPGTRSPVGRRPGLAAPGDRPAKELQRVIAGVRNLLVGLLVSLATLFLVIAGILYIAAGGDMRAVENAKTALKSAVVGYLVAGIATFIVEALQSVIPK